MEAIIERCCGLDVHKDVVVACVLIGPPEGRARKEIRTYRTTATQLEQLRDSLGQSDVRTLRWKIDLEDERGGVLPLPPMEASESTQVTWRQPLVA
jgi:hypothetical protein